MAHTIKLLLIEDDVVDQLAFKRLVRDQSLPYDYTIATGVTEARELLTAQKFDVVVADYSLGDGNLFDIFNLFSGTPAIITTGLGREEIAIQALKLGAFDYLIKDVSCQYLKVLAVTVGKV